MIAIVDYGRGNLYSIRQGLRTLGRDCDFVSSPENLLAADQIILPGVGAFGDAMASLNTRGLVAPLLEASRRGTPILGICLGMQLLASRSEEFGQHRGLDLIPGTVRRLPEGNSSIPDVIRVPNVGWRPLTLRTPCAITAHLAPASMMYFVHSYAHDADNPLDVVATIDVNGKEIAAITCRGNIYGCQFHPEKSGTVGLNLLGRFLAV